MFSFLAISFYLSPRTSLNPVDERIRFSVSVFDRSPRRALTVDDVQVSLGGRAIGEFIQKAYTVIRTLPDSWVEWDRAEQLNAGFLGQSFRPTRGRFENLTLRLAPRTNEPGHVLDEAQDLDADFPAKVDLFPDVLKSDLLRRGDEHGAINADGIFEVFYDAKMFIRCAWRSVDQHPIEVSPIHVPKELRDYSVLFGPAPDHGGGLRREKETYGHGGEVRLDVDRGPTGRRGVYGLV